MMIPIKHKPDLKLDLVLERIVDVPRELVWRAWTTPEQNEKLVWTTALAPGYRPTTPSAATPDNAFSFRAVISLESHGNGTKYTALIIHGDAEARKKHEEMGFHDGWGKALDQLVAVAKKM